MKQRWEKMNKKIHSGIALTLLLVGMLTLAFNIQPVEASGTIYITSDYTFTHNIYEPMVVQADNIVIDGNGYTLQGPGNGTGFHVYGRSNVTIKNTIVRGFTFGIYLVYSSGNTIQNNMVAENGFGIYSDLLSSSNTINGNSVTSNRRYGITLWGSWNNNINENNISGNQVGINILFYSSGNMISDNEISSNLGGFGFISGGNTLRRNRMIGNEGNFGLGGIWVTGAGDISPATLPDFINDIDTSNTINGKPIYYLTNQENLIVDPSTFPDIGYLALINSTNITVKDLTLEKNGQGVLFAFTTNSIIKNVNASNNEIGIWLFQSNNTIISNSIISDNNIGLWIQSSSSNTITNNIVSNNNSPYGAFFLRGGFWDPWGLFYHDLGPTINNTICHNNIIDNTVQAYDANPEDNDWHHPTLLEGNYWSDYPGVDDGSGTGKHSIAGDGIGDTDIPWPGPHYDYYPFIRESGWMPARFIKEAALLELEVLCADTGSCLIRWAKRYVAESLDDTLWMDDWHLTDEVICRRFFKGWLVFCWEAKATCLLEKALKKCAFTPDQKMEIMKIIDKLVEADRMIALTIIEEKEIPEAHCCWKWLHKGDEVYEYLKAGGKPTCLKRYKMVIIYYGAAWKCAMRYD
jgi:parallel beta-helix repeat protein